MKNFKLNQISIKPLFVFVLSISIIISCKKEFIEPINMTEEQIDNSQIPIGQFSAELEIYDAINPLKGVVLSVSTNNEEIFAQLKATNFKATILAKNEIEASSNQNVEDIDKIDGVIDVLNLNTDKYFLSIKTISEKKGTDEVIKITLGYELNNVIRKFKAQTHVQITNDVEESNMARVYQVNRNAFTAYGDGGSIPTRLNVRYKYINNSATYYWITPNGFINNYTFRTCEWPNISSSNGLNSSRCIYTSFVVVQDVLMSYTPYSTNTCIRCY